MTETLTEGASRARHDGVKNAGGTARRSGDRRLPPHTERHVVGIDAVDVQGLEERPLAVGVRREAEYLQAGVMKDPDQGGAGEAQKKQVGLDDASARDRRRRQQVLDGRVAGKAEDPSELRPRQAE